MKGKFILSPEAGQDSHLEDILKSIPLEAEFNYGEMVPERARFEVSVFDEFNDEQGRIMYRVVSANHPEQYGVLSYETDSPWNTPDSPQLMSVGAHRVGKDNYPCVWIFYRERVFIFVANEETWSANKKEEKA